MSRRLFQHYLLLFFSANAILICGSSRRIPRRASCPSCSQDCPEALTVQVPWYSYRESNLQPRVQDFSVSPFKNSPYSRLTQGEVSQDMIHDDSLSNQNSIPFGNYRSFPRQESANENVFFRNLPNAFSESLDRREIFPGNKPISEYSFAHVFPPRQSFDRSENLFFRSPRDKYSESSSKNRNFQDYKENPASKLFTSHRADRNTKPWENSKGIFLNNVLPQGLFSKIENLFPSREHPQKRNLVKTTPNSIDQQYKFANPPEIYYPEEFGVSEIKHDLHVLPQNLNIQKTTKEEKFFDNLDRSSLQSWNGEQLRQAEDDFLEVYPPRNDWTIITNNDNKQNSDNPSELIFSQDLNIWKPTKYGESFNNWEFASKNSPHESAEIKQLQKVENNWPQLYPPGNDIIFFAEEDLDKDKEYFDEEYINQKYFKDEIDKDTSKIARNNYNPYNFSQNMNIWRAMQNKELSDDLDFMFENSHEMQKGKQLDLYSQNNNKYFQDKANEDIFSKREEHADIDQIIRAPLNPHKTFLPRYLNIFNNAKHPAQFSESQESTQYSVLHKNPVEERNARFFDNKAIIYDAQDSMLPKNIFDPKEYSEYNIPAVNGRWQNTESNIQNKVSTEFDPDQFDDVENPPTKPTEPTPMESHIEFPTSQQH